MHPNHANAEQLKARAVRAGVPPSALAEHLRGHAERLRALALTAERLGCEPADVPRVMRERAAQDQREHFLGLLPQRPLVPRVVFVPMIIVVEASDAAKEGPAEQA